MRRRLQRVHQLEGDRQHGLRRLLDRAGEHLQATRPWKDSGFEGRLLGSGGHRGHRKRHQQTRRVTNNLFCCCCCYCCFFVIEFAVVVVVVVVIAVIVFAVVVVVIAIVVVELEYFSDRQFNFSKFIWLNSQINVQPSEILLK